MLIFQTHKIHNDGGASNNTTKKHFWDAEDSAHVT